MTKAKTVKSSKNSWVRLTGFVTLNEYNLIKKIVELADLSMAEVTRIMLDIAVYFLMGDLEQARKRAASLPHRLPPEIFQEFVK